MTSRVLLLEPNSRLFAMLERSLSGIAQVLTSTGVDRALDLVQGNSNNGEELPDLIVSEYSLADGTALDLIKALPESNRPPFILLASRAMLVDQLRVERYIFDEILLKPILVSEFRERIEHALRRRHLRRQMSSSDVSIFKGRLEDLNLVDLLQALEIGGKTGGIHITSTDGRAANIDLLEGQVRDAVWLPAGEAEGDAVVYEVLQWQSGWFEVDFERIPARTTVTSSTQWLLLEGMRLLDEGRMGMRAGAGD